MEHLYALVVNGSTYYLKGNIPKSAYNEIENLINSIAICEEDVNCSMYLDQITEKLKNKLQISLIPINVKYVFRKRK